jgi:predicted unusual protein kinase regulating ubiquinone biosynthesis (AarF/ABC1/UbiB family)
MAKKQLHKIKSSLFSRGLTLAKMSINTGAKIAAHGVTQALKSQSERDQGWNDFLKNQTQVLTREIGELKGSLMKAGQMLSVYGEHFFPPEVAKLLRNLHQDSPPLKWEVMEKLIVKYLGKENRSLLKIGPESIGTASLGQVHKAEVIANKEILALKVQYPDIEKAIDSDLKALRSFLYLMKLLPKDFNTDPIFHEIHGMLIQETDYIQEAELTAQYYQLLAGDPRFVVPKVHPEFSNKRILATSFEHGVRVDDPMIQNLSQDRRNRLALNFMELYFKEIFEWQFVQTDPHFGNYRIRLQQNGEDQIVLFDFGATRRYPDQFMKPYQQMIKSLFYNDRPAFEKAARKLKFLKDHDNPELQSLFEDFCFDTVEPFLLPDDPRNKGRVDFDGTYDWKNTDLPQRSSKKIMKLIQNFEWRVPPREIIFLDRKAAGVFIFLSHLGAKIRGRELLESYLKKI